MNAFGADEKRQQATLLQLSKYKFDFNLPDNRLLNKNKKDLYDLIMKHVHSDSMAPFYKTWAESTPNVAFDENLYQKLVDLNTKELESIEAKIKDAIENQGESEVRDGHWEKAKFFARIGDKDEAIKQYEVTMEKTVGTGRKIDLLFEILRISFFWNDSDLLGKTIERTKEMVERGGDWERRNRLKVYEATFLLMSRKFEEAGKLLLDSIATFTCTELYSYNQFVWYTVLCSALTLDRVSLREKVIDSPDIKAVINEIPHLELFLNSLYDSNYAVFFDKLVGMVESIRQDEYISLHEHYYLREIRIVAYSQFFKSYKSVTLTSMAKVFGVSEQFLDKDLSRFIASKKLNCKIDKVKGVVETVRADAKNLQYQAVIENGDVLLNRIQKLARVITF